MESAIRMQLVSGLQIFKPLKLEQQEMTAVSWKDVYYVTSYSHQACLNIQVQQSDTSAKTPIGS